MYAVLTADGEEVFDLAKSAYLDSVERHFASRLEEPILRQLHRLPDRVLESRDSRRPSGGPGSG